VIVDPAWRPAPRRLARILIAYGVVGLVVAAFGLAGLIIGLGRIDGLSTRLDGDLGGVSATLSRTATVLDDAAATARGFGGTIDGTTTALTSAATDIREIVPRLRDVEFQANALNILGTQPLAPIGGLFGQIAGQLADLDAQLDTVSSGLAGNRGALDANATSLAALATETRLLGDRLGEASLGDVVADARMLLVVMLGVGTLGAAVPGVGALLIGLWLLRSLNRSRAVRD
jgi:hypothetical protein